MDRKVPSSRLQWKVWCLTTFGAQRYFWPMCFYMSECGGETFSSCSLYGNFAVPSLTWSNANGLVDLDETYCFLEEKKVVRQSCKKHFCMNEKTVFNLHVWWMTPFCKSPLQLSRYFLYRSLTHSNMWRRRYGRLSRFACPKVHRLIF